MKQPLLFDSVYQFSKFSSTGINNRLFIYQGSEYNTN